jgi:hypothetical protein
MESSLKLAVKSESTMSAHKWAPKEVLYAFVKTHCIRSWREYQSVVRTFHIAGKHLNIPVDARRVYRTTWSASLFNNSKYANYETALRILNDLGINSKNAFEGLSDSERQTHRLPATMTHYEKFPGWNVLRRKSRPVIGMVRKFCFERSIFTKKDFLAFAKSEEGLTLKIPQNPAYFYKAQWQGWGSILAKEEVSTFVKRRTELILERGKQMREEKAERQKAA